MDPTYPHFSNQLQLQFAVEDVDCDPSSEMYHQQPLSVILALLHLLLFPFLPAAPAPDLIILPRFLDTPSVHHEHHRFKELEADDTLPKLPPDATKEEKKAYKKQKNTHSAKMSRLRKNIRMQELEEENELLRAEREKWRTRTEALRIKRSLILSPSLRLARLQYLVSMSDSLDNVYGEAKDFKKPSSVVNVTGTNHWFLRSGSCKTSGHSDLLANNDRSLLASLVREVEVCLEQCKHRTYKDDSSSLTMEHADEFNILGRARFRISPIGSCPPEIMHEIFSHLTLGSDVSLRSQKVDGSIFHLTWICQSWRKLILGRGRYWSRVDIDLSLVPDDAALWTS
ncbi:hypothetical protein BT96DRAFT_995775 [Gymnopus androsaceus JB14]|uniref:BZIP domain-containing protein n=1 Tax=Gymnopus androsaceus JB14 TaxID=1447944 RepID=A0A6A4HIC7_9AGAR|nr:hypothetical protein BT96DRAFT_995775 [Gymnopus androsaceus JB14]